MARKQGIWAGEWENGQANGAIVNFAHAPGVEPEAPRNLQLGPSRSASTLWKPKRGIVSPGEGSNTIESPAQYSKEQTTTVYGQPCRDSQSTSIPFSSETLYAGSSALSVQSPMFTISAQPQQHGIHRTDFEMWETLSRYSYLNSGGVVPAGPLPGSQDLPICPSDPEVWDKDTSYPCPGSAPPGPLSVLLAAGTTPLVRWQHLPSDICKSRAGLPWLRFLHLRIV